MIPSRVKRVSETLKEVLSEIIQLNLKDPHVGFVTVTGVEMTPDLKQAKVWVSVMGDEEETQNTPQGLETRQGLPQSRGGQTGQAALHARDDFHVGRDRQDIHAYRRHPEGNHTGTGS